MCSSVYIDMEEVLEQFNNTVIDSFQSELNRTSYTALHKNWGNLGNQEQRRKDILEIQRSNRNGNLDSCRGIMELVNNVNNEAENNRRASYYGGYRPSIYVAGFTKASTTYKDVLMMSEWMVEKPSDFHENWYVVPCPKGVRTLVVACNGSTKLFNKYGSFKTSCRTALPGGNPADPHCKSNCVILDCFYAEPVNTIYVLDVIAWNRQPMSNGETEFRHYWIQTHIEEIPELKLISANNKIIFHLLPKVDCKLETLNSFMMTMPYFNNNSPVLDGLLFYHKKANYVSGVTPLVGWLYPFMVNEILGPEITVNPVYVLSRPANYVDQATFIKEFESKAEKKAPKFLKDTTPMETNTAEASQPATENPSTSNKKERRRKNKHRHTRDAEMKEEASTEEMESDFFLANYDLFTQPVPIPKPRFTMIRPEPGPSYKK